MPEEDGKWMTFQQLAELRGTTKRAAVMLVRRHKWRRERNNAGHTIALVPATFAAPPDPEKPEADAGHSATNSADHAVAVLEQALSALREAHGRELLVLHSAHHAEVSALRKERDQALAAAQEARQAAMKADQDRAAAVAIADEAVRAAEDLRQVQAAKAGQGRWARLRAAWRGV